MYPYPATSLPGWRHGSHSGPGGIGRVLPGEPALFRHPNEYYTAGEEPDGVWFNPKGLFGLADGGKVDSSDFHRLYNGFAPNTGGKLTQNAGSERRSAGLDLTFSADKSVSALWAVADPDLRSEIERAHNDAARVALEETVLRHCAYTRIRNRDGEIEVLPADISAAMFQHGTSRDNDPSCIPTA